MCSGGISLCSAYNFANLRESVNNADWHELEKAKLAEIQKSMRNASLGLDRFGYDDSGALGVPMIAIAGGIGVNRHRIVAISAVF